MTDILSIDIGNYQVKFTWMKKNGKEYTLKKVEQFDSILINIIKNEKLNMIWLEGRINNFMFENKIGKIEVFISIAHNTLNRTRIIQLPLCSDKEIVQSLPYLMEEEFQISEKDAEYKWIEVSKTDLNRIILINVMNKNFIKDLKELNKRGKIKIKSIEPQLISFQRFLPNNQVSMVIDFGFYETRVIIYKDFRPIHFETIEIGSNFITNDIRDKYFLSWEEAEVLKKEKGYLFNKTEDMEEGNVEIIALSSILMKNILQLSTEIKQIISKMNFLFSEKVHIDHFYYTGGGFKLGNVILFLNKELSINMTPFHFLENNTLKEIEMVNNEDLCLWIPSLSPALYKKSLNQMNFSITKKSLPSFEAKSMCYILSSFSLSFLLTNLFIGSELDARLSHSKLQLETVKNEVQELSSQREIYEETKAKYQLESNQYENLLKIVDKVGKENYLFSNLINDISILVPKTIYFEKIDLNESNLKILGNSPNYSDIGFLTIQLNQKIGTSKINKITSEGEKSYVFEIEVALEKKKE